MRNKEELLSALDEMKRNYGEWTYDIPLPFGVWTRGNEQLPHTRLKRIVQVVSDLSVKPLSQCRVLDLGCLDGLFSIEFAQQGAHTVGVEIREANIQKAILCQRALALGNLEFRQDDVRNVSEQTYGRFDAIICSGILYHLPASDAVALIRNMHAMVERVVVIDTHIALAPLERVVCGGEEYWGSVYREHADDATAEQKTKVLWSSADNPTSFWFTRPSLINILTKAGFTSVYECFVPTHLNFGQPGQDAIDRCTFVAVKDRVRPLLTSPRANDLSERWPEHTLSYAAPVSMTEERPSLINRAISRLKEMIA